MVRSGRNSNSSEILCLSLLPVSKRRFRSKATEKRWRHHFTHYKSMGAFRYHGHQSFDPVLCSLSPTPVMLHIKFYQDWPTGFWDIQVWKCGRRRTSTTDDGRRRTDDGPLVYYKLTLWAFGPGELIKVLGRRALRLAYVGRVTPGLGKRQLVCVLLVHLIVCVVRVSFCHLSLPLGAGVGCSLWLWQSLDFSGFFLQ